MTQVQAINGTLEYRQFIILEDGTEHRVKYNQDPSLYEGKDVPVFAYTATEGKGEDKKEVTKYAVPYDMAIRSKRASLKDALASLKAQGLTPEEIIAKLSA